MTEYVIVQLAVFKFLQVQEIPLCLAVCIFLTECSPTLDDLNSQQAGKQAEMAQHW